MPDFTYSRESHRYRGSNGRYISTAQVQVARQTFQASRQAALRAATVPMTTGSTSVQEWTRTMRAEIKSAHLAQAMLGKGGRANMTRSDWLQAGRGIQREYQYLARFGSEVAGGKLSAAQIEARAALYGSSSLPYERARAADWGVSLPAMPGVGTLCRANCRCSWEFEEDDDEVRATWTLSAEESCDTCLERADAYSPFTVAKATEAAA